MKQDLGINERIRKYRKGAGFNQMQIAEKLGIKAGTYSQMERRGYITAENLRAISEILEVHPLLLLYGDDFKLTDAEKLIEERCQKFYDEIKEKLENEYFAKFHYLKGISSTDRNGLGIIFQLKSTQRVAVYEYAYDIFRGKIKPTSKK